MKKASVLLSLLLETCLDMQNAVGVHQHAYTLLLVRPPQARRSELLQYHSTLVELKLESSVHLMVFFSYAWAFLCMVGRCLLACDLQAG